MSTEPSVIALVLTPLMVAIDAQARIAFASDRDWNWEIYVMDNDGGNQRNLTNNPADDRSPSWSPDGQRILFASDRDRDKDGHFNYEIYVMDADGGNQRNLTNHPDRDYAPSWSPDGRRIAFASDREGDHANYEIYVMDDDGGNLQNLTNHPHGDVNPAWFNSPFSVSAAGKKFTMWGRLKQVDR